jgi:hypothetical protein
MEELSAIESFKCIMKKKKPFYHREHREKIFDLRNSVNSMVATSQNKEIKTMMSQRRTSKSFNLLDSKDFSLYSACTQRLRVHSASAVRG